VVERFASGVVLLQDTCPGLVGQIEKGEVDTLQTRRILEKALHPMLEKGIDTIVLGCTHYPFVIPIIQEIVGPNVRVIDPAPAVARQAAYLMEVKTSDEPYPGSGWMEFFTSSPNAGLEDLLPRYLGETGPIRVVEWRGMKLGGHS
jgi:glutamate racemase